MNRKVVSCSQFFQETDILELKLETLWDYVDYFIISESNHTHSGQNKIFNLLLPENKKRFEKYSKKIIYQKVRDTPSNYTNLRHNGDFVHDYVTDKINAQTHWPKNVESYGRDSWEKEVLIVPLLRQGFSDEAVILFSDLDEIVKPESLQETLENFNENQVYNFAHGMYYYYMNVKKQNISLNN